MSGYGDSRRQAAAAPGGDVEEYGPGAVPGPESVSGPDADVDVRTFAAHRSLLFTVAYEVLGSVADAEDVVQETYLRWSTRPPGDVDNERAYLVRITTRLALNRLRTVARRREDYVGPWLPEPLITAPDVSEDVVLAESVSLAMLVVLESLSPSERAVFVLREVFGFEYGEIADAVGKTPAATRQLSHRAHEHVQARRPRFEADPATAEAVRARFVEAMFGGDVQGLMDVLAPDVVLLSDGGGKRSAARRPVHGRDDVARFLVGLIRKAGATGVVEDVVVNGAPAWALVVDGVTDAVAQVVVEDGRVAQLLVVVNPDKLASLAGPRELTRDV